MSSMTYNSLVGIGGVGVLPDWLERGQSITNDAIVNRNLNTIVNNAERRIAIDLKILGFVQNYSSIMPVSSNVIGKPDRWRETISINFSPVGGGARQPIFPRSLEYCRTIFPDDTQTGPPQFYADYNYLVHLFAPTPDQAYPFEINFWELPVMLSPSVQTNYLTDYAPLLLQLACLWEANILLKDPNGAKTYEALYKELRDGMSTEDIKRIKDRSNERVSA